MSSPADTGPVQRPHLSPYLVLFVSVAAISWSAPLIRLTDVGALTVSFWRLTLSIPIICVALTVRGEWSALRQLSRGQWLAAAAAGILLAAHFWTWIASLRLTTVAASVALLSTQPVWVAIFAIVTLGERPSRRQWLGIAVAVGGSVLVAKGDWGRGGDAIIGDALALLAACIVAGYYVIGRGLRRNLGVWPYVAVVNSFAALALLVALLLMGIPVAGPFQTGDWLVFGALAIGPMIIGHTGQNYALAYLPAFAVNLSLLGEPVVATIIAWLLPAIAEPPPVEAVAGGALILTGILLGMRRK
jgi:drug/metabolite transporter (DMT)-like permease